MNRKWLLVTTAGVAIVVAVLITSALVIFAKPTFGGLVGPRFLPIMSISVIAGGLLVVIGAWQLGERRTWRGIVLLLWGLVAALSPVFGFLFVLPWSVLAVLLPAVFGALVTSYRSGATVPAATR